MWLCSDEVRANQADSSFNFGAIITPNDYTELLF